MITNFAIKSDDQSIVCWGQEGSGQCSDIPEEGRYSYVSTSEYTQVICAVKEDDTLVCWGTRDTSGQYFEQLNGIKSFDGKVLPRDKCYSGILFISILIFVSKRPLFFFPK
jgi:hypothetical protein